MEPVLHPSVEPLAFLLGTWKGEGDGVWPGAEPFHYGEEMIFEHVGEEFLMYSQRSWTAEDGSPLHFERGFFHPAGPGRIEVVLAHPLGIVEVSEGTVEGTVVDVASTKVELTSTASPVTDLRRRIEVRGDILAYALRMAMRDIELTRHVTAELRRV
jgi:hypothetical protein